MLKKIALVTFLVVGAAGCGAAQADYGYGSSTAYSVGPCYDTYGDPWVDPAYDPSFDPCPTSSYFYGYGPVYHGMNHARLGTPVARGVVVRQHAPMNRGVGMVRGQNRGGFMVGRQRGSSPRRR